MEKHIYDEVNGLWYTLHGDYYLPDLEFELEEPMNGIMRQQVEDANIRKSGKGRKYIIK